MLSPGFVNSYGCGVGKIHRASTGQHGQPNASRDASVLKYFGRQTGRLWPEHQHVAGLERDRGVERVAAGGEREDSGRQQRRERCINIGVHCHDSQVVIVQSGAAQLGLGEVEAEWLNEVQFGAGDRGEADCGPGVASDARLEEQDAKNGQARFRRGSCQFSTACTKGPANVAQNAEPVPSVDGRDAATRPYVAPADGDAIQRRRGSGPAASAELIAARLTEWPPALNGCCRPEPLIADSRPRHAAPCRITLDSPVMATPERVRVTHTYTSDPATVFNKLSEHENLGPVFGAKITRVRDGDTSRNGAGSTRSLKIGALPAFEETTTVAEPNSLIEYKISKGGPLRGHWGKQVLTPTLDGGTKLVYTIGFNAPVPGMATLVGKVLTKNIAKGLGKLTP